MMSRQDSSAAYTRSFTPCDFILAPTGTLPKMLPPSMETAKLIDKLRPVRRPLTGTALRSFGTTPPIDSKCLGAMGRSLCARLGAVDNTKIIESAFAVVLKARGFRKRARNWFRTTSADEYQVVNLQKAPWGDGSCYVNLGWSAAVPAGDFRTESMCALSLRAEDTDAIPPINYVRPDGLTARDLPGTILLDSEMRDRMPETSFVELLTEVVIIPIADFMDRTPSLDDLVPLLKEKPWLLTVALREELHRRGHQLPRHVVPATHPQ
jgi:hypothetical protein